MMAARGRGQRMSSFTMDAVRGDGLPPMYNEIGELSTRAVHKIWGKGRLRHLTVMEQKPLPLTGGEEAEYLLALKQDFRGAMRSLPCFIQPVVTHRDVERYSDKYNRSEQIDRLLDWAPDWKRFPRELRVHVKRPVRDGVSATVQSPPPPPPQTKKKNVKDKEEVLLKLESLEKKEEQEASEDEEGEMKKKQEEEAEVEEEYDEEEFEEETDYIMSYFDNGEDFAGDSDDNMDEAIY